MDELEKEEKRKSEVDEMWSFVSKKEDQIWLSHAIDRRTGKILSYTFGRRKDEVFLELKKLLKTFGITQFYTDGLATYQRHLDAQKHIISKQNTQKTASKHINLRT